MQLILCLLLCAGVAQGDQPDETVQTLDVKKLSLVELAELVEQEKVWSKLCKDEAVLLEIVRRGEKGPEKILQRMLDKQTARRIAAEKEYERLESGDDRKKLWNQMDIVRESRKNLNLLTALRRAQKKPDPLSVEVSLVNDFDAWLEYNSLQGGRRGVTEPGAATLQKSERELAAVERELVDANIKLSRIDQKLNAAEWKAQSQRIAVLNYQSAGLNNSVGTYRQLIELAPAAAEAGLPKVVKISESELSRDFIVTLKASDTDRESMGIKFGGHNRSGRLARWRFEVRDSKGHVLPVVESESVMGGGIYQEGWLGHGECWKTSLPLSDYVKLPGRGEYSVTVLYHNDITIADIPSESDLGKFIVFRSAPFKIEVVPDVKRKIQLKAGNRKEVRARVEQLPKVGMVKIVCGTYGKPFHQFIKPESEAGQLLQMSWEAVPELLASLDRGNLTRHQKAWVCSLLYTITRKRELAPWASRWYTVNNSFGHFVWQLTPHCRRIEGDEKSQIDPAKQDELLAAWREYAVRSLEIYEAPGEPGPVRKP